MRNKTCQRCGRELTQKQCWNHCKYCSRSCSDDALYGEKIEWNGIWIRPGQTLEVLKLFEKGLSESEVYKAIDADFKTMQRIRKTPELAIFLPKRVCLFCGKSLPEYPLRKYCSTSCQGKAQYDRERIAEGRETRRVDYVKRNRAIDLFARGLDSDSIARYLDLPVQRIKHWVYSNPINRASELCPELIPLLPLKHRLTRAQSATEWRNTLHDASKSFGTSGRVVLVTETLHGGGAPNRYASIVLEKLKQNIVEGVAFAFCNVLRNAITLIEWKDNNFRLTRTLKSSGTFVWPGEHLGEFVSVTKDAFSHLLTYQKSKPSRA
jgi:predicted nucleic acid-binding Zn ribbon protein